MGCTACAKNKARADAARARAKSTKNISSNDYGLASLQTLLADMEKKLISGVAYKAQWSKKLAKKRHHLVRVYPERVGLFDQYIQDMETASVQNLAKSISTFRTITGTAEQFNHAN